MQGTVGRAVEPQHPQPHRLAHPAHLPVTPLVKGDLQQGIGCPRARHAHPGRRAHHAGLELDAAAQPRELVRVGQPVDPHAIDLLHPVARMHQVMGEVAVVGEEQETAGVGVQPSDREQPAPGRQQLANRTPPLGVVEGGDYADRLVEGVVARRGWLGKRAPAHQHAVTPGLHLRAGLRHQHPVDPHHSRLDQGVALAPRPEPPLGEQLVEADAQEAAGSGSEMTSGSSAAAASRSSSRGSVPAAWRGPSSPGSSPPGSSAGSLSPGSSGSIS